MASTEPLLGAWPRLKSAREVACDGRNPRTDEFCLLGHHRGPHRDEAGDEWLDDGDLAKPDWITETPQPSRSALRARSPIR
ncbi:hypothetical protein ACIA49_29415 [Kribbella sp. NPDC051587]|uniref:hypothetical protein n=1 Tax=Kribbella sp. NPDC051587 TaxID=3364119 RepID=UPI0037B8DF67